MMFTITTFWISVFCALTCFVAGSPTSDDDIDRDTSTLQLVFILHRHGMRAPEITWPTDPYKNEALYWRVGWSELLPEGRRQLYALGKILRERYKSFISRYSIKSVYTRSSDHDRCLMSAGALLAGWFPPECGDKWTDELIWQPIPIHTIPVGLDWVLARGTPCPRYNKEMQEAMSIYSATETEADRKLFAYLSEHMGMNITSLPDIGRYYQTMEIEESVGYTLEDWTKAVYPDLMNAIAYNISATIISTPYLKKMLGGAMLQELLRKFTQKSMGDNPNRRLLIYSAHDYNLIGLWLTLGLEYKDLYPVMFGAAFSFELRLKGNDYFVKMFYFNDTTVTDPYEITIPHCGTPCYLPVLFNITNYMRAVDPVEDCELIE